MVGLFRRVEFLRASIAFTQGAFQCAALAGHSIFPKEPERERKPFAHARLRLYMTGYDRNAPMTNGIYTVPNIITLGRFVAIPVIVYAIASGWWALAFVIFALAGISDGVDGYIARQYRQDSVVGRFLDPLADKSLTIAVYSAFAYFGLLPVWLLLLIVARDVAILAGAAFLAARGKAGVIRPLPVSKLNTVVLIVLAGWVLASRAFGWSGDGVTTFLVTTVCLLTAVSAAAYGRMIFTHIRPRAVLPPVKQPDGL
jgi:cardiolipin synthase